METTFHASLTLVPSLANCSLSLCTHSLRVPPSHTQTCHSSFCRHRVKTSVSLFVLTFVVSLWNPNLPVCSHRILTCRIKSIRSPAKVGLVVTDLITSPVVSWEGWETPPPPPPAPRLSCHSLLNHRRGKTSLLLW